MGDFQFEPVSAAHPSAPNPAGATDPVPDSAGAPGGAPALVLSRSPSAKPGGRSVAWRAVIGSRLIVLCAGVLAVLEIGQAPGSQAFDPARLTSPFGYFGNLLMAPFARWDSVWYLAIARGGYAHEVPRTAFFPLYPLVTRGVGLVIGSDLLAGVLISLACFAVAMLLFHRLVCLELDSTRAEVAVLLLAFCPMAYFFSAVYTESLFLALSLGCLLCARSGRWALAGGLGALAALSRNSGVVLVVPVLIMFLYGPRTDALPSPRSPDAGRRPAAAPGAPLSPAIRRWAQTAAGRLDYLARRFLTPRYRFSPAILWAGLIPLGLLAYLAYLGLTMHDAFAPFHAQAFWYRHFVWPFAGVWKGAVAAWDGLRQLVHGPAPPVYFKLAGGDPLNVAGQNLLLFGALVVGVIALIGTFRELPFAYGAYVFCSLAMPLADPDIPQPLASLPRYEVVLFPLFMWVSSLLVRRRLVPAGIGVCAVLLGLFTADFATWRFVA